MKFTKLNSILNEYLFITTGKQNIPFATCLDVHVLQNYMQR